MARLVLVREPGGRHPRVGDSFPLVAARTVIGRSAPDAPGPDARPEWVGPDEGFVGLATAAAARRHAELVRTATGYAVRHLRSRSFVTVNGRTCPGDDLVPLAAGDVIRVCDYDFTFHGDDMQPEQPERTSPR